MIEEHKALQCLMLTDPDKHEVKDILESNKNVAEVLVLLKGLKRGDLLEISFDHGAMSDTSCFYWVYHSQHECGIIVWVNDCMEEPRYEDIETCTSKHLGVKLADLLDINGFEPENIDGDKVKAPLEGMEIEDLVYALANGVYTGHHDNPEKKAAKWIKTHVKRKI